MILVLFIFPIQALKTWLIDNGGSSVVNEFEYSKTLSTKMRNLLLELLVNYVVDKFGLYPTRSAKIMLSKATVQLFPNLHTQNSKLDGIVRINYIETNFLILTLIDAF